VETPTLASQFLIDFTHTAEVFHSRDPTGFAKLDIEAHRETWPIRTKGFRWWAAQCFFEETAGRRV
jgi:hypothetical protein